MLRVALLTAAVLSLGAGLAPAALGLDVVIGGRAAAPAQAEIQAIRAEVEVLKARLATLEARLTTIAAQQARESPYTPITTHRGTIESSGRKIGLDERLPKGTTVQVQHGGSWWAGEVLEELSGGTVKIHYTGWGDFYDEVVPRSRLQHPAGAAVIKVDIVIPKSSVTSSGRPFEADKKLTVGMRVQIQSKAGTWWDGTILEARDDGQFKITYTGYDSTWDEVVPRSRLQYPIDAEIKAEAPVEEKLDHRGPVAEGRPLPEGFAPRAGMAVQIQSAGGNWWEGRIVETSGTGAVKVRYVGWSASWDEFVPLSRIRLPPEGK